MEALRSLEEEEPTDYTFTMKVKTTYELGLIMLARQQVDGAREACEEALELFMNHHLHDFDLISQILHTLSSICSQQGDEEAAAAYTSEAQGLWLDEMQSEQKQKSAPNVMGHGIANEAAREIPRPEPGLYTEVFFSADSETCRRLYKHLWRLDALQVRHRGDPLDFCFECDRVSGVVLS